MRDVGNKINVGDIVKIRPKWLGPDEDPDTEYLVIEDWGTDMFPNGRIKVLEARSNSVFGYSVYVYSYDMVYKEVK